MIRYLTIEVETGTNDHALGDKVVEYLARRIPGLIVEDLYVEDELVSITETVTDHCVTAELRLVVVVRTTVIAESR